ncbi:uncharacterized protein [Epargyreus clarus]|uniref:uncharacterized protein n=1 Tax=Epargyreus clarus TaxID=520877 RepID=UPI003C2C864B
MGYKKKKNVIILTLCVVACFILYQLYFFLTITSVASDNKILLIHHDEIKDVLHLRSEHDKYISDSGILRGIHFSNVQQYRPDVKNEFKCRTSDQRVPFEQVNDDYCDCEDGTDEPSTNACPNGVFYCENQGQKKLITKHTVPSSHVNDGICDCCDGSDEWLQKPGHKLVSQTNSKNHNYYVVHCPNICNKHF